MQALELLHSEFDIDLLLLDINMPRLDGFGVLEVMKQRNWLQEIPVIITSSEDDESFIQKVYELGVTDYIRRPFNLTVTQWRVSNALTLYARQKHLVHLAEEQVYEHEKTNSAIINILSHIVESRNFESGTHILHVRHHGYSAAPARGGDEPLPALAGGYSYALGQFRPEGSGH